MPFDVPNIIFSFTMASEWCITLPLSEVTIGFYDEALCTLLLANSQQKEQINAGVGQEGGGRGRGRGRKQEIQGGRLIKSHLISKFQL